MSNTVLSIAGEKFLINGRLTYEDAGASEEMRGLLMNARFVQGVFDDAADRTRFNRFGRTFDPEANTDALIAELPAWYAAGLRAITVGFQGGGPCFTMMQNSNTISNNPYSEDGLTIDPKYLARMARILDAADKLGMVVIVSLFYVSQVQRLGGVHAILNAVRTASAFLKEGGWRNVIVEIANEYNLPNFSSTPIIQQAQGMVVLMELARKESGLPVGCSGCGGAVECEVAQASDVVLIHCNGMSRQQTVQLIQRARKFAPGKPVVCNEDSQALGNMQVCMDMGASWGYYNNMTKQEPPTDWSITRGEDQFFAWRMAKGLGLAPAPIPREEQFVLMGLGAHEVTEGKCWPRLASLYPEQINHVDFYLDGKVLGRCYDDPYTLNYATNWMQMPHIGVAGEWKAVAVLRDGTMVERTATVNQ
jgi:hypothetical protein